MLLYVPGDMEEGVIRLCHEKLGHLATDKCLDSLRENYWFPSMRPKVDRFVQNCLSCIMHSIPKRAGERKLHSIPKVPLPFDTVHIDHLGPLPSINSKRKYFLVVVDAFTKFTKLYATNTTSTKEVCASLEKYFDYYSRPRRIISDRGTCFTSFEFSKFLLDRSVEHIKVATASPQANGQVERVNRVLNPMLAKLSEPVNHADWVGTIPRIEYALNNSVHSSTEKAPSVLLFGTLQRGRVVDDLTEYLQGKEVPETAVDLPALRQRAESRIIESQARNERLNEARGPNPRVYAVGEYVVIRNVDTSSGANRKLIPKYRGPYRVKRVFPNDRYEVTDVENCQLTQIPYRGILESARLKPWIQVKERTIAACS